MRSCRFSSVSSFQRRDTENLLVDLVLATVKFDEVARNASTSKASYIGISGYVKDPDHLDVAFDAGEVWMRDLWTSNPNSCYPARRAA